MKHMEEKTQTIENKGDIRTKLVWDNYMEYLITAINESKFMKRAENKPMSTPKTNSESHLTSRAIHLRQSADIAKRLAHGLGLNSEFIYAGMLMHDAGHPFSAHEGEEIFNYLNELTDCQYFHHNSKGVEVILSEDICGMAINKIPNIENNPELRKQLEEEFYYFLDVIISHDGEASRKDMQAAEIAYPSIKEAVMTKKRLADSENNYKFVSQTPEGKLAKMADVIAYVASDLQDAFRTGIMTTFSDNYLEILGEILSKYFPGATRQEKIDAAKNIISQIQEEKVREQLNDVTTPENKPLLEFARTIKSEIQQKQDSNFLKTEKLTALEIQKNNTEKERIKEEIIEGKIQEYRGKHPATTNEDKMYLDSETDRIREFTEKMLEINSSVIMEITSRIQDFLISDVLRNSQGKNIPQYSDRTLELVTRLKQYSYSEFIKNIKFGYQTYELPQAALQLVRLCARNLRRTGIIRTKFYDMSIRKYVTDEQALKYMTADYDEETRNINIKHQERIGVRSPKTQQVSYTSKEETPESLRLRAISADIFKNVQNQGETFAIRYNNTFFAIPKRAREKVEKALMQMESGNEDSKDNQTALMGTYFKKEEQLQLDRLKKVFCKRYPNGTAEDKEQFTQEIIQEEYGKMHTKMSYQLAIDYLAGMTDRSFTDLAVKSGVLSQKVIDTAERGAESQSVKRNLENIEQDTKEYDEK